jgi:DNA-binding MarR family transcriptional regulator
MLDSVSRMDTLALEDFVPFRVNRLADAISSNLSEIYRDRFGLEVPEWRVLVTVGERRGCTAQYIVHSTRMHKTRVSRAVSSLEERRLVTRDPNFQDGREMRLCLTNPGQRMYAALVPLALDRECALLACLSATQRRAFLGALTELERSLGLTGTG